MLKSKLNLITVFIVTVSLFACHTSDNKPLLIKFSPDSTSIRISNIEPVGLLQLKNNINSDTTYQNLVTVLVTPGENDSLTMEKEWPGKLSIKGDELDFKPDSPFVKGKYYLVSAMLNLAFGNAGKVLKGEMETDLTAQEQLLKR